VETATAVGTISTSGTAAVTISATDLPGSPISLAVPVLIGDTAAVWAGKVRTALSESTPIANMFTVSGTGASIVLTRKPSVTFTIRGLDVPIYFEDDASLNIDLGNGTCAGITPADTSSTTVTGVATTGVKIDGGGGKDWEGNAVTPIGKVRALLLQNNGSISTAGLLGAGIALDAYSPDGFALVHYPANAALVDVVTITSGGPCDCTLTVFGEPA
jgi:hypothetical protein